MPLIVGDKAPDFSIPNQDGIPFRLSSLKGKKVILYFYPKDMTSGCTAQACNLRDNYKLLKKNGFEILGLSCDSEQSHQKFIAKEKLPFQLLSDVEKKVSQLYGTWVEKSMYGRKYMGMARTTFIIDENGQIEEIITKVDTKNHTDQILKKKVIHVKPAKAAVTKPSKKTISKSKKASKKRK